MSFKGVLYEISPFLFFRPTCISSWRKTALVDPKMTDGSSMPSAAELMKEMYSTNYLGLASFVLLVYDHMLTFDDEVKMPVKYIWQGKKKRGIVCYQLGFNQYLFSYASESLCNTSRIYCEYLWGNGLLGNCDRMLDNANSAVCNNDRRIMTFMWLLFLALVVMNVWLITTGGPVSHPNISAWTPLIFDTAVLTFVVLRTRKIVRAKILGQSHVVHVLIRDGIVYYVGIFTINLVLAIMIVQAADGVKNICSQLQLILTVRCHGMQISIKTNY
ncbi:hypothetical protein BU17DRAFT_65965 [Hysterangium stoloniferum]|nr:hypothetical protein BU17DRAFT_65965 [Hysterangium stoloniferum]